MVLPTVTEIPLPLQRIEHDAFAESLALRENERPTAEVVVLRGAARQLAMAA